MTVLEALNAMGRRQDVLVRATGEADVWVVMENWTGTPPPNAAIRPFLDYEVYAIHIEYDGSDGRTPIAAIVLPCRKAFGDG